MKLATIFSFASLFTKTLFSGQKSYIFGTLNYNIITLFTKVAEHENRLQLYNVQFLFLLMLYVISEE